MEFETVLRSDLNKTVQVQQLTGNLFSGDNKGNKITVELFQNGSPATLTGDVSGYVIRADGKTVVIADTQGTHYTEKSGNRYSVILPQSAYVVVGQVSIVIKVGTVTVGACTSYVYKSTTDQIIDPGSVVPDISTLMGIIEDCIGATEDAETATLAAQSAAAQATAKISEINSAIIASGSATAAANTAASGANSAKTAANTAATSANTAASSANTAASSANTAALAAQSAANYINGLTVIASTLQPSEPATATVSTESGHAKISFGIPKGADADPYIDDTKGIGDTDYVWSADQNDKLYGIQDGRTNELFGLVNYGYDTHQIINANGIYAYSITRNKNIFTINGTNPSGYDGRVKICNGMARQVTAAGVKEFTDGIKLIARHEYRVYLKTISGSYSGSSSTREYDTPLITVYEKGEATSIGTASIYNGEYARVFTAEDDIEYMICLYVYKNATATNYICSVTLEDLSIESTSDTPVTKAPVIEQVIDTPASVVSFSDGADDMPMEVTVGIEPVQDLHGYEYPWAGGNGKNLANFVQDKGINSSGNVIGVTGRIATVEPIIIEDGISYVYNSFSTKKGIIAVWNGDTLVRRISDIQSGTTLNTNGGDRFYFCAYDDTTIEEAKAMIVKSTETVTEYEPYSNICPISGHSETNITHNGKNLVDWDNITFINGYLISASGEIQESSSYKYTENYMPIDGGKEITVSIAISGANTGLPIAFYDSNKNFIERASAFAPTSQSGYKTSTFVTPSTASYYRFNIYSGATSDCQLMIEYGSTATEYAPFYNNVINVTFPSDIGDEGVVYGGTLTVNKDGTGTLALTHLKTKIADWTWTYTSSYGFRAANSASSFRTDFGGQRYGQAYCTAYKIANVTTSASFRELDGVISIGNTSITNYRIIIQDDKFDGSATAFKEAMGDVEIVYEMSDAQKAERTYTLSVEQVKTLLGVNRISCDTGNVLKVAYPADTKTYIDQLFATIVNATGVSF